MMESLNQWAGVWVDFMLWRVGESTLVFAVVGMIWLLVRKRVSPQFGYGLFFLPLLKLVFWIPVELPVVMPSWISPLVISETIPAGIFVTETLLSPIPETKRPLESGPENDAPDSAAVPSQGIEPTVSEGENNPILASSVPFTPPTVTALVFLLWLWIVGFLAMNYLVNQFRFRKTLKSASPLDNHYGSINLNQLRQQAGVRQTVRFVMSSSVNTPVVWGIWRPYLILPSHFGEGFTPDQMKWILLHELAHIRRWDLLAALFQRGVGMLFFFHPVVWVTHRTLDRLREYICDDMALVKSGISRQECGEGFLAVAEQVKLTPAYADTLLGFMGEHSSVWRRMMRILDAKRKLSEKVSFGAIITLLLIAVLVLPSVRAGETQTNSTDPAGTVADATATNAEDVKPETEKKPIIIRQYSQKEFMNRKPIQPQSQSTDSSLSNDGRYLAQVDWDTGNLVVKDQQTGESRDLTKKGTWDTSSDYAEECLFATDNRTIAYSWYNDKKSSHEIWLVDVDGTNNHAAYNESSNWLGNIGWTSKGYLFFERDLPSGEVQLRDLSLSDHISRILLDLPKGSSQLNLSQNKEYAVWHQPSSSDSNHDIFLYSIPENRQVCLVQHPEDDKLVDWSPNEKWIIFKSNRLGEWSLWGMPVSMDTAESAVLLKRGTDSSVICWISADGKCVSPENKNQQNVYIAELDFKSGEFISTPQPICDPPSVTVSWSKSGKYLSISREVYPASQPSIYCPESKTFRNCPTKYFNYFASVWADNDRLLIGGGPRILNGESVFCRQDVQTGEIQELFSLPKDFIVLFSENSYLSNPERIMFLIQKKGSDLIQIVCRDLTTGKEEEIYTGVAGQLSLYNFYLTNDQKWIYFMIQEGKEHVLKRISLEKQEMQDLFHTSIVADWHMMPDEQNIALLKRDEKFQSSLWNLHIESREIRKILQFPKQVDFFAVHPDGRHLAYTGVSRDLTFWVMENFLPEEAMN